MKSLILKSIAIRRADESPGHRDDRGAGRGSGQLQGRRHPRQPRPEADHPRVSGALGLQQVQPTQAL